MAVLEKEIPKGQKKLEQAKGSDKAKHSKAPPTKQEKPPLMKTFEIFRFNPEKSEKPTMQTFTIDINK